MAPGKGLNAYIRRPMSRRPAAEEGGRLHRLKIDGGEALASEVAPPIFRDADFLRPPLPQTPLNLKGVVFLANKPPPFLPSA